MGGRLLERYMRGWPPFLKRIDPETVNRYEKHQEQNPGEACGLFLACGCGTASRLAHGGWVYQESHAV